MKALMVIIFAVVSYFIPQENARLKGTYRVEFDKKYAQQGYNITFNDSMYVKKMPDAVTYKGVIRYEKYRIILRKNADEHPIEIDNREMNKDTIKFSTKNKKDISLTINRGKMIKLK